MVVGHVTPEAFVDRTLALVEEGDAITIDAHRQLLQLSIDEALLQEEETAGAHQRHVTQEVCLRSLQWRCLPGRV